MNMSVGQSSVQNSASLQRSSSDGLQKQAQSPVDTLAVGVLKNVADSPKLVKLSEDLQNIDEKIVKDFASHLNGVMGGKVVSDEVLNNAIKGLSFESDNIPVLDNKNPELNQIDDIILDNTKNMMARNVASFMVGTDISKDNNPDNISLLPVAIPSTIKEKLNESSDYNDEKAFTDKIKKLLPNDTSEIFQRNYDAISKGETNNIKQASAENINKITSDIVDDISKIYQLSTIRLLAQLGSGKKEEGKKST
jgi:hypothetical protein